MTGAAKSAKTEANGVQVNVNIVQSVVTIGNAKVEISADGKKVTAYTNDGVEMNAVAAPSGIAATKGTRISISEDFNTVAMNGVTVERAADGHLVITAPGGTVTNKPASANDTCGLEIAADGWKYVGISVDTGTPMYVAPADSGLMRWHDAMQAAKDIRNQGKTDARLPSKGELNQLFNSKARIGGFNETGYSVSGWYWSSSEYDDNDAKTQRFSDGSQDVGNKGYASVSVRLVRSSTI